RRRQESFSLHRKPPPTPHQTATPPPQRPRRQTRAPHNAPPARRPLIRHRFEPRIRLPRNKKPRSQLLFKAATPLHPDLVLRCQGRRTRSLRRRRRKVSRLVPAGDPRTEGLRLVAWDALCRGIRGG
ncbi:hypothetical protein LINPERPRIM_LOCUS15148, partial [Linum perenne]